MCVCVCVCVCVCLMCLVSCVSLGPLLGGAEGRWVMLLLQVHLHELIDSEIAGGSVSEVIQPESNRISSAHSGNHTPDTLSKATHSKQRDTQ